MAMKGILVFVCCSVFLLLRGKPIDAAGVGMPTSFPVSRLFPSPPRFLLIPPPLNGNGK